MSFALLALICAVALIGPVLASNRRIRLPVVVGELVVGIGLGATGLGLLDATNVTFEFMAQIGFALVMFVAGSHVPLRNRAMVAGLLPGLGRAAAVGILAVPVGYSLATVFGSGHGPLYAVVLASSSASLVLPAMATADLTSPQALPFLVQLAVADAACIIAIPLAINPTHAGQAALGALAVVGGGAVLLGALVIAGRRGRAERLHAYSQRTLLALELRITLVVLFSLAAIAVATGVSVMLAGFVAGLVVAAIGEHKRVQHQLFALSEGFFGPIFFVWLGASLKLRHLVEDPSAIVLGLALGLGALLIRAIVAALTHQPWALAGLTGAQLGVPVGAVALGTQLGVLSQGEGSALLLGAVVTIVAISLCAAPARRELAVSSTLGHAKS